MTELIFAGLFLILIGYTLGWVSAEWNWKEALRDYREKRGKVMGDEQVEIDCLKKIAGKLRPSKWRKGKLPKNKALVWVKRYRVNTPDRGIGEFQTFDGAICGLSGEWDADPMKDEWQPVEMPK